jgi:heme-degrading monooxygenase HmoA
MTTTAIAQGVRATLRIGVLPGREQEFEDAWGKVAAVARGWPGNLRQSLLRAGDGSYLISSDWVSRAAFGAFERSEQQDELTAPIRALRTSASMEVTEIVLHVEAAEKTVEGEVAA